MTGSNPYEEERATDPYSTRPAGAAFANGDTGQYAFRISATGQRPPPPPSAGTSLLAPVFVIFGEEAETKA
eukprot:CAMPEP_0181229966 /NCGR_PEP_ID=MMETSP1096-20121128/34194_1 /TAXON_ID=156174 ORGANISM="Chrysochromulina ericina, Strain CCMP281" /NCGR_SAMPLE_ID=MMETSP1096 /ASSEMBLY_ACC=CAM_ASM_000453 /LENGTH=70 /DNA_ID=CAMNT_0023323655 /DNA_START=137 /DNA_END=350 /DNA_ORIENTATION=+